MVGGCPGTLASSTTKTGRHDIAEILLKVALKHQKWYTGGRLHTNWICCNPRHGALLQVPLETF
jgi:hypothetical protein